MPITGIIINLWDHAQYKLNGRSINMSKDAYIVYKGGYHTTKSVTITLSAQREEFLGEGFSHCYVEQILRLILIVTSLPVFAIIFLVLYILKAFMLKVGMSDVANTNLQTFINRVSARSYRHFISPNYDCPQYPSCSLDLRS